MRNLSVVISLGLLFTACGSKKEEPAKSSRASAPTAPTPAAPSQAAPKPAADLFSGPKVSLPPPVARLALDMPEADARAAAPDVFAAKHGYEVPGYEGVEINTQMEAGRLYQIRVELDQPVDTVKTWMEAKWGAPRVGKDALGKPEYYFDSPDVGLRAKLEDKGTETFLRYSSVMSLEQLLGAAPTLWGFEKAPLLGMTEAELMQAYAMHHPEPRKDDPTAIRVSFPALTTSRNGSHFEARIKDGKVSGYTLSIHTGGDAAADAAVAARLEQLFGKGKPDRIYTKYPSPAKASAQLRTDSDSFGHTIWVGDYKKEKA